MTHRSPLSAIKRLFSSSSDGNAAYRVDIGDRFVERDEGLQVWIVDRISSVSGSLYPLVSLHREGRPEVERTLSLAALNDNTAYRRRDH